MRKRISLLWITALLLGAAIISFAQDNQSPSEKSNPMKKSDVINALESNAIPSKELIERISQRGVDFELTDKTAQELKVAGANDALIEAVCTNFQAAPKKKGLFGKMTDGVGKAASKTKEIVSKTPVSTVAPLLLPPPVTVAAKTAPTKQNAPAGKTAKTTNGESLKIGEYACTGSGGRILIGLGFKVLSGNRYTDLDNTTSGTFSIEGSTVKFRGGHLDGQIGRDLRNYAFTIGTAAHCEPF